jgi:hypothetical protein
MELVLYIDNKNDWKAAENQNIINNPCGYRYNDSVRILFFNSVT